MAFARIINWYRRYERPVSSLSLVGGFVFDALTLKRVDTFWENFWVLVHLLVVAAAIFILNRVGQNNAKDVAWRFWLINLLQFAFGGLLSTFLVFYFRSATLGVSWPFLIFLVIAFIANERLKKHYERLAFQIGLFYLSLFLFLIFAVPVVLHRLGPWIFLLSGVLSLAAMRLFLMAFKNISKKLVFGTVLGIFALMNLLYFTGAIPPIPLSLKEGGIYHALERTADGNYLLTGERHSWFDFLTLYDVVHASPGESLYAYTAVFSPGAFSARVIHEWQYYDESVGAWTTIARVSLSVSGGRDQGYRTYSVVSVKPGKFRVNVLTPQGQVIGRIDFKVVSDGSEPNLEKVLQ